MSPATPAMIAMPETTCFFRSSFAILVVTEARGSGSGEPEKFLINVDIF
jgi:hypothetical protein